MCALGSPVRQTHPQASHVVSAHIITPLLDGSQKTLNVRRAETAALFKDFLTPTPGRGPDTRRALDTYMALADVLLQL